MRVDEAEKEPEKCMRENVMGASVLPESCARLKLRLMAFSSGLVFDGGSESPYIESDAVSPLNIYGKSKSKAKRLLREMLPDALVIRTSSFFGPWDDHNFLGDCVRTLLMGETIKAADDLTVSSTHNPDLANACLDLLLDGEKGVWHLASAGALTWAGMARYAAEFLESKADFVIAVPARVLFPKAERPRYSVLGSERNWVLPTLEHSLEKCMVELTAPGGRWQLGTRP